MNLIVEVKSKFTMNTDMNLICKINEVLSSGYNFLLFCWNNQNHNTRLRSKNKLLEAISSQAEFGYSEGSTTIPFGSKIQAPWYLKCSTMEKKI